MVRSRVTATLVLFALIASSTPVGVAQAPEAPDPCEPDCLRIQAFSLKEEPYVISEGTNTVEGELVNKGSTPMQVRAYIEVTWNGGQESMPTTTYLIPSNTAEDVEWGWNGPGLDQKGIADQVTLELVAWVEAGGQEVEDTRVSKSIKRSVQYNDFNATILPGAKASIQRGSTETIAIVEVTNTGNVEDTAKLSFANVPQGWTLTPVPAEVDLGPGTSANVSVVATAPSDDGTYAPFDILVETSEVRADDADQGLVPLRARLEDVETPTVTNGDSLRVTFDTLTQSMEPPTGAPSQAQYAIQVYNPTAGDKTVRLELGQVAVAPDVTATLSPTGQRTLDPGEAASYTVTATVDPLALASTSAWWISTKDVGDGSEASNVTIDLAVNQTFGVDAAIDRSATVPAQAEPGSKLAVPLNVTNLGNGNDTVCITAALPTGWSTVDDCVEVAPQISQGTWNGTVSFDWVLELDPSSAAGPQTFTFQAESQGGSVGASRQLTLQVPEQTHPEIRVPPGQPRPLYYDQGDACLAAQPFLLPEPGCDAPLPIIRIPCVFGMEPGTKRAIAIGLANGGNTGGAFQFAVDVADEHPGGGWTITPPAMDHTIAAGDDASTAFEVQAPSLAAPDDFLNVTLLLEEVDEDGQPVGRVATQDCLLFVAYPDLVAAEADARSSPDDLYTQHPSVLHFQIINTGWAGTGDVIEVQSVIEGPNDFQAEQTHILEALDSYPGTWWRALDVGFNATKAGDYTYTLELDPDHLIEEPDQSEGGAPNTLTGAFTVHDFGISVDAPPGRTAVPEQIVSFEHIPDVVDSAFRISNDPGGAAHTLTLNLTMVPAWKSFPEQTITLEPGADHRVNASFRVPELPLTHEVRLTLRAANATLPSLAVEDTVRVRIDDAEPPVIRDVTADARHVLLGTTVNVSADITDAAGVAEARLIVAGPQGTVTQIPMERGAGSRFTASTTPQTIGNHTFHVWARDAAVSNNTADTSADPITLEVLPADRPHVRLVTPADGAYLRPGTPVVLTVLSQRPIVEAQYELAGGDVVSVPFANPLQLATDDWPEGPATVRVDVRDAVGVAANGTYSFRVDGTAPTVSAVTLDPADAAPGAQVRLTARLEDASGIAAAEVRMSRSDGRADVVNLTHESGSVWTAQLTLPRDVVAVTVVATDAAGNRGMGERRLENLDETDDKGLPLPALPLLVVAFAAAGWSLRRRSWR